MIVALIINPDDGLPASSIHATAMRVAEKSRPGKPICIEVVQGLTTHPMFVRVYEQDNEDPFVSNADLAESILEELT